MAMTHTQKWTGWDVDAESEVERLLLASPASRFIKLPIRLQFFYCGGKKFSLLS